MTEKTILVDDLDGSSSPAETVPFSVGPQKWEIDLTAANQETLRGLLTQLEPFVTAARPVTPPAAAKPRNRNRSKPAARRPRQVRMSAEQTAAIRAWATENGHTVNERGPVGAAVINAYRAAHPEESKPAA